DKPISELAPSNHVTVLSADTGDIRLKLRAEYSRARILAKVSYHPFWRLERPKRSWLRESPERFLVVDDLPAGGSQVSLLVRAQPDPRRDLVVGVAPRSGVGSRARHSRETPLRDRSGRSGITSVATGQGLLQSRAFVALLVFVGLFSIYLANDTVLDEG